MIAFEVSLNGKRLTVAGAEDLGVMSVILAAAGNLGPLTVERIKRAQERKLTLSAGGITSRSDEDKDEFLDWVMPMDLNIGDDIHVKLLELEEVDKPVFSRPSKQFDHERELFEYAKKHYFELRDKYENNPDATS